MNNTIMLFIIIFMIFSLGCIDSEELRIKTDINQSVQSDNISSNEKLYPVYQQELYTGQNLKIYEVNVKNSSHYAPRGKICFVSEIINVNGIVTSGGLSCP